MDCCCRNAERSSLLCRGDLKIKDRRAKAMPTTRSRAAEARGIRWLYLLRGYQHILYNHIGDEKGVTQCVYQHDMCSLHSRGRSLEA